MWRRWFWNYWWCFWLFRRIQLQVRMWPSMQWIPWCTTCRDRFELQANRFVTCSESGPFEEDIQVYIGDCDCTLTRVTRNNIKYTAQQVLTTTVPMMALYVWSYTKMVFIRTSIIHPWCYTHHILLQWLILRLLPDLISLNRSFFSSKLSLFWTAKLGWQFCVFMWSWFWLHQS